MGFADHYLKRFSEPDPLISIPPAEKLKYVVVVPAFNESGLINSLDSLFQCTPPPDSVVEIITVINWPEGSSSETKVLNEQIFENAQEWSRGKNHGPFRFHFLLLPDMPGKHAGVGFARKYGMDEAIRRFNFLDKNGIILSFDADASADPNLFTALDTHFSIHTDISGCNIYFEHPLKGKEFPPAVYEAIILYELHLRYYYQALRYTGHPNCFHTVGSCFAVRAKSYCSQGGMNKRKAGEDFYFLQKLFDLGSFSECRTTRIIPSPRPSNRVPFGTGPVVDEYLKDGGMIKTFHPRLFEILRLFFERLPLIYDAGTKDLSSLAADCDNVLRDFLNEIDFPSILTEIHANSSGYESFRKRFFRRFNMFRMLKFLNSAASEYKPQPADKAAASLLKMRSLSPACEPLDLLQQYRDLEKGHESVQE